jgi:predicted RNA-binding protein with PIN domain
MATLIDGYNLLHAAGILGRNVGPGTLERARNALLGFLAASLNESERAGTTVVFDAKNGPPGLPRELRHRGIRVLYAVGHEDADDLMKELIRADSSPRRLVVVSSDHQIQRAATRRRATTINSDRWYAELCRQRRTREPAEPAADDRPVPQDTAIESAYWVRAFSEPAVSDRSESASASAASFQERGGKPDDSDLDFADPFPPGYADDLLAEDGESGD